MTKYGRLGAPKNQRTENEEKSQEHRIQFE